MTAYSGLPVLMISLVLLFYPNDISMVCTEMKFRLFPAEYDIEHLPGRTFQLKKSTCLNDCLILCSLEKFCDVWKSENCECQLFHTMNDCVKIRKENSTVPERKTYYKIHQGDEWTKVFFFKSGSGVNVFKIFMKIDKINVTKNPDAFVSFFIKVWHLSPIRKVKLSLLQNDTEIHFITFDARDTNNVDWFIFKNVIQSSWQDLRPELPNTMFNIIFENNYFVADLTSGNCSDRVGWLTIVQGPDTCEYGIKQPYPYIRYSNQPNAVNWSKGFGIADAMALYISF